MRVYPDLTVDGEFEALGDLGHTGTLNDRQFSFLTEGSFSGALSDMLYAWRSNPFRTYAVDEYIPTLVADMVNDAFGTDGVTSVSFDDLFTTSRLGNATMVDSDGLVKWGPHNLLTYSEDFSNAAWAASQGTNIVSSSILAPNGTNTAFHLNQGSPSGALTQSSVVPTEMATKGIWARSASGTGTAALGGYYNIAKYQVTLTEEWQYFSFEADSTETGGANFYAVDFRYGTLTDVYLWGAHLYRSDLGGMAPVPSDARVAGSTTYVPTTSTAKYLPRRHNHVYDGSAWVDAGTLIETEARTQLLHTTDTLVTQSHTVTAVPHTLHFTGTGTVTLSGASTAGPLVGTGTGEENRVSLTFTPTAASLTLTVTGTVTDAQLEVGATPSSYIPNLAGSGTVIRAADSPLTIAGADVPWPTPTVIGDELVTNGTFDTDSDWTKGTGWTIGGGVVSFVPGSGTLTQSVGITAGNVYEVTFTLSDTQAGTFLGVRLGGATNLATYGGVSDGVKTLQVVAESTDTLLKFAPGVGGNVSIDNISVKEINPLSVCIQMDGDMTYADEDIPIPTSGDGGQVDFFRWKQGNTQFISSHLVTNNTKTGEIGFVQRDPVSNLDIVREADDGTYSPGVNVPFNIASRHGSTFINGAVDGTALTADTTPVVLPDLSATDLQIAYDFMGNVKQVRIWAVDIGDTGIAEASS